MKLSLVAKSDCVHVRGGRVMRASEAKCVSRETLNKVDPFARSMSRDGNAKQGDLLVEVVEVTSDVVVAHAFMSGDACQLIDYAPGPAEPAVARLLDIKWPKTSLDTEAMYKLIWENKFDPDLDVAAFDFRCAFGQSAKSAAQQIGETWNTLVRNSQPRTTRRAHLVGHAVELDGKNVAHIHVQPPDEVEKWCATSFSTQLVVSGLRHAS